MKNLIACLVFLIITGCKTQLSENKSDSIESAPITSASAPVIESVFTTFSIAEEALDFTTYIEPGTDLFADSTNSSSILFTVDKLTPVKRLTQSNQPFPLDDNICNQYFWYKVELSDTRQGWVFGESVLNETDFYSLNGEKFDFFPAKLRLLYMSNFGGAAVMEDGPSGCDKYTLPFFFDEVSKMISFIGVSGSFDSNTHLASYRGWLSFISNEGGGAEIASIQQGEKDGLYEMMISVHYQDGGSRIKLLVEHDGTNLKLISTEVMNDQSQSEETTDEEDESDEPRDDHANH